MINLSLGGVRDPDDPRIDTFSPLERDAVAYAYSKGVVVVVAVGNGPDSPSTPWGFADWPASLPHVIGVAALREDGSVPDYSNRDALFVDLAAPGDAHLLDDPAQPDRRVDAAAASARRTRTAARPSSARRSGRRSPRRRSRPPRRSCSARIRR